MQRLLNDNWAFFFGKVNILPVMYKRAIRFLEELNEHVGDFCTLLDDTASLPPYYLALHHRLLAVLHLIEEQPVEMIKDRPY
jgi:hypothetical protein